MRAAEASLPPERDDLRAQLSGVVTGLVAAVEDLQEISRGIHPAILSKGGLGPAVQALAHRSAIPVDLAITIDARLAEPIEVAAYFVVSEALANAAKHSQASRIDVSLDVNEIVFNQITLRGIYGRQMYEDWYKMSVLVEGGLDIRPAVTHRFPFREFEAAFAAARAGNSGKVIMDWGQA